MSALDVHKEAEQLGIGVGVTRLRQGRLLFTFTHPDAPDRSWVKSGVPKAISFLEGVRAGRIIAGHGRFSRASP